MKLFKDLRTDEERKFHIAVASSLVPGKHYRFPRIVAAVPLEFLVDPQTRWKKIEFQEAVFVRFRAVGLYARVGFWSKLLKDRGPSWKWLHRCERVGVNVEKSGFCDCVFRVTKVEDGKVLYYSLPLIFGQDTDRPKLVE